MKKIIILVLLQFFLLTASASTYWGDDISPQGFYITINYPSRLISSLLQHDKYAIQHETKRFILNTTFYFEEFIEGIYKYIYSINNLSANFCSVVPFKRFEIFFNF